MNRYVWVITMALAAPVAAQIDDERYGCEADLSMTGDASPAWEHLGASGDTGGDWDADGLDDILVGGGVDSTSRVFLYLGRDCPTNPCSSTPVALSPVLVFANLDTSPGSDELWTSCAFVGDINGEGEDDIAIGEAFWSSSTLTECGRVLVFFSENHQSHTPGTVLTHPGGAADVIIEGDVAYGWFGYSLDGLDVTPTLAEDDLVVGAPGNVHNSSTIVGEVYVFEGDDIDAGGDFHATALVSTPYAGTGGHSFGYAVARIGDVNSDGKEEFIVGSPQIDILTGFVDPTPCHNCKGYAQIFSYTSLTNLSRLTAPALTDGSLMKGFGYSVAGVMSMNGNSVRDVIVGAPWYAPYDTSEDDPILVGGVYVYEGSTGSLIYGPISPEDPLASGEPDPKYTMSGLGFDVDGVEDFDPSGETEPDGKGDILVGAPMFVQRGSTACGSLSPQGDMLGRALIYSGADGSTIHALYKGQLGGGKPRLGFSVASGFVNDDGAPDTYAGQLGWSATDDEPPEEGRAFIFFNGPCCP